MAIGSKTEVFVRSALLGAVFSVAVCALIFVMLGARPLTTLLAMLCVPIVYVMVSGLVVYDAIASGRPVDDATVPFHTPSREDWVRGRHVPGMGLQANPYDFLDRVNNPSHPLHEGTNFGD